MTDSYRIWMHKLLPNVCQLDELGGFEREALFQKGVQMADEFPSGVTLRMNDRYPDDILLADNLRNNSRLCVISQPFRSFLEAEGVQHVEYLPVSIVDHKGRVASAEYYILNPIGLVDCLVTDQCEAKWSAINKEKITRLKRFVIDASRIDETRLLFRPRFFTKVVLVREDLAARITAQGLTGVQWRPLEEAAHM